MDTKNGIEHPHPSIPGYGYDYGLCGSDAIAHAIHSLTVGNSLEETFVIASHKGSEIFITVRVRIEKSSDPAFDRFRYTDGSGTASLSGGPSTPLGIYEAVAHLTCLLLGYSQEFSASIFRRRLS